MVTWVARNEHVLYYTAQKFPLRRMASLVLDVNAVSLPFWIFLKIVCVVKRERKKKTVLEAVDEFFLPPDSIWAFWFGLIRGVSRYTVNPLSANVEYIRHDTVVTSDSCNSGHSENYEKILIFSCKSLKFSTEWYTKFCILVDPFLRNCVTKSNFRYFKKKAQKRLWHLKG